MPLTGGYRRTPMMQIGADIYCDSQCILRELERRFPEPTFFPGGQRSALGDQPLDGRSVRHRGANHARCQRRSAAGGFREGPRAPVPRPQGDLSKVTADLPHTIAQLRAQFGWMDQRVSGGRSFILGNRPALPDALCYYLVWFIRGRWHGGPGLIAEFSGLEAWEQRVKAIGHGRPTEMTPLDAIEVARSNSSTTSKQSDPRDPQGSSRDNA